MRGPYRLVLNAGSAVIHRVRAAAFHFMTHAIAELSAFGKGAVEDIEGTPF